MLSFEIPKRSDGKINRYAITDKMFEEICSVTQFVKDTSRKSLSERIFCIKNNLTEIPKCPECGKDAKWQYGSCFYSTYCSNSCMGKSEKIKNQKIASCLLHFGAEHPAKSEKIQNKRQATNIERYGVKHPAQNEEVLEKMKKTNIEKYGVESPLQSEDIKEKIKMTNIDRYGVEYPLQSSEILERYKQTNIERYGVEYPSQVENFKTVLNASNIERYGEHYASVRLAQSWKERRNSEGTDIIGDVYFLHFPNLNAVKIGLTSDLKTRFRGLKKDFGEFSVIKLIETETCRKLESYFHEKFAEYRICLFEGSGRTEFFREDILTLIKDEI